MSITATLIGSRSSRNGTRISDVKNPHTIMGLKKGSTYYFVVTAVNESGESEVSESISYTVEKYFLIGRTNGRIR